MEQNKKIAILYTIIIVLILTIIAISIILIMCFFSIAKCEIHNNISIDSPAFGEFMEKAYGISIEDALLASIYKDESNAPEYFKVTTDNIDHIVVRYANKIDDPVVIHDKKQLNDIVSQINDLNLKKN